jgi:hypothetical protein
VRRLSYRSKDLKLRAPELEADAVVEILWRGARARVIIG